jgi:hypothetical protein
MNMEWMFSTSSVLRDTSHRRTLFLGYCLPSLNLQVTLHSRLHIRQLIYISLYPPPQPKRVERVDVLLSPRKAHIQRQKQDLWPRPGSRPLAIALLNAFIRTNSPECLTRGLPYYSYIDNDGVKDVDPFRQEKLLNEPEDHSPMRNELSKMQSLKDCWGLLMGGLVKRKKLERSQLVDEEPMEPENAIVGRYAWPVLEWLVQVFEKEERRERENSRGKIEFHIHELIKWTIPSSTLLCASSLSNSAAPV